MFCVGVDAPEEAGLYGTFDDDEILVSMAGGDNARLAGGDEG
jgi:hypothetical protein